MSRITVLASEPLVSLRTLTGALIVVSTVMLAELIVRLDELFEQLGARSR